MAPPIESAAFSPICLQWQGRKKQRGASDVGRGGTEGARVISGGGEGKYMYELGSWEEEKEV